jgi:site-specific DNA-cytosine methylase
LAILGWPYQGLSHAHANQGLKNPRSWLFYELIQILQYVYTP